MEEEKHRSIRQVHAYIEVHVNKMSDSDIIREILKDGLTESEIEGIISSKRDKLKTINVVLIIAGILGFLMGISLTRSSYDSVSSSGGHYFVYFGLMIVGPLAVVVGIVRLLRKN
jgi:uncharacterized membrane protein